MHWMLLILGCGPTGGSIEFPDDFGIEDSDEADTDDTSEPPVPRTWVGSREFTFEYCADRVTETGVEITHATDPASVEVVGTCGQCDEVYRIQITPDRICNGYVVLGSPGYRGLAYGPDGEVVIYAIGVGGGHWTRSRLADGQLEGDLLTYAYSGHYYQKPYSVVGEARLR